MKSTGILYIIAAASGTGKTSLVDALLESTPDLKVSISHTTRPKRPGEENGIHYYFIDTPEFEQMIAQNAFLEYAQVYDYHYGTSRNYVEQNLQAGFDVILEIDWQGAALIRQKMPEAIGIFILPPSLKSLQNRLQGRAQDNAAVITKRMAKAHDEMSHYAEFDYLVINDHFEVALADLRAIIRAQRLLRERQQQKYKNLLLGLLK